MTASLSARLDQILPRVTSDSFLSSEGIGNEIACYIFDYPPSAELDVRRQIAWMMGRLASQFPRLRVLHLNLLDVLIEHLTQRGLLDKTLQMGSTRGDAAVLKALRGILTGEKLRDAIAAGHRPAENDLVFLSGAGSVWPMMRVHGLLNCLHAVMEQTPLVLFYPGSFDGTALKLFGRIATAGWGPGARQYYRAFPLIPEESTRP